LSLYKPDGVCSGQRKLNENKHLLDTKIEFMSFSETEARIGCVNSDYTLSFWDMCDDLKFEKTFKTDMRNEQIYYIEFIGQWVTFDKDGNMWVWNLEEETAELFPDLTSVHKQNHKMHSDRPKAIMSSRNEDHSTVESMLIPDWQWTSTMDEREK